VAVAGGSIMLQVVNPIEIIETSSKKIINIISVFDSITLQTNPLPLDCHGKGSAGQVNKGLALP
jgi:methyl-accepting chemotaxis protein